MDVKICVATVSKEAPTVSANASPKIISIDYGEKKTDKEKSHKGIWRSGCPGGVPGTNSGRPRDTWDIWA